MYAMRPESPTSTNPNLYHKSQIPNVGHQNKSVYMIDLILSVSIASIINFFPESLNSEPML